MSLEIEPVRAAGVMLVAPSGSILFLQRGAGGDFPGSWAFPGGKIEDGEAPDDAAARECEEEAGFRPPLVGAPLCRRVKDGADFTTFVHKVDEEFIPTLCDESTAYAWAPPDHAPEPLHPGCVVALARAGMNELGVARAMVAGDLVSPQRYGKMSLYDMRLTGTGLSYRGTLDEHVYRRPEIYLNQDFLDRCAGLPVIWIHPPKNTLDSKEFARRVIGAVMMAYIKGDDVWAICRVYDDDAIAEMDAKQLSTSPAVVFRDPSENTELEFGNGSKLLIEGEPTLLDHLAVVPNGVWDKGGEPSGIRADAQSGEITMAKENEAQTTEKADGAENIKDLIVGIADSVGALCKRMDAFEEKEKAKADADKKDAEGKDAESKSKDEEEARAKEIAADKARKDAEEEKAKEEEMKAKADAAKDAQLAELQREVRDLRAIVPKQMTDADYMAMTDAQARADAVFNSLGKRSAPRPLDGETPALYRRRLATALKAHSKDWKDVDLSKIDEASFGVIEPKIYADAAAYAAKPDDLGSNELRMITERSPTGHTINRFVGKTSFVAGMMPPARTGRLRHPSEFRH